MDTVVLGMGKNACFGELSQGQCRVGTKRESPGLGGSRYVQKPSEGRQPAAGAQEKRAAPLLGSAARPLAHLEAVPNLSYLSPGILI